MITKKKAPEKKKLNLIVRFSKNIKEILTAKGITSMNQLKNASSTSYTTVHMTTSRQVEPRLTTVFDLLIAAGYSVAEIHEMKVVDLFTIELDLPF